MNWKAQIRTATKTSISPKWSESTQPSEMIAVSTVYPVHITPHYHSLIDKTNPNDPLLRIVAPHPEELSDRGLQDTMGEHLDYIVQGVQHRYPATALLLVSDMCASYCRFCFRKRIFNTQTIEKETIGDLDMAIAYIESHKEITNVLLSGGDPLINSTNRLRRILGKLAKIRHVQAVRIGTKVPAFLPQRILEDEKLLDLFEEFATLKPLFVITHFDHKREISPFAEQSVQMLLKRGVQVLSQTVLLKGVNDNEESLQGLFEAMIRARIEPYYLFHPMPVIGAQHFQVPLAKGWQLVAGAQRKLSGLHKRYRYILPHFVGKLEFLGFDTEHYYLRYQEARDPQLTGKLARVDRVANEYWFDKKSIQDL